MTDFEWRLILHLRDVNIYPGLAAKRVISRAQLAVPSPSEISPRMRRALVFIGHRYRRQLPADLRCQVINEYQKYLAADSAGGGARLQPREPRAGDTLEPKRPTSAQPASPLQGRETLEGLLL